MNDVDTSIMRQVAAGDTDAIAALFDRHADELTGFFVRQTGDRSVALDLVQTTFERILKYRRGFRGDALFRTWMYRIARNAMHSRWTTESSAKERARKWMQDQPETVEPEEPSDAADRLQQALKTMSPAGREVLLLAKIQQLNYDDVADILGCSNGAVKVRVYRAMQELRKTYETHL